MYELNLIKITANEKIIDDYGIKELYESFFIVQLYEDIDCIIGIVKNDLCWQSTTHDDEGWDLEKEDIPFDYGDCIIYNKETKKINLYNDECSDTDSCE